MTARIVYMNARDIPIPPEDYVDKPTDGASVTIIRDVYTRAGTDTSGSLWERVAEGCVDYDLHSTDRYYRNLDRWRSRTMDIPLKDYGRRVEGDPADCTHYYESRFHERHFHRTIIH